MNIHLISLGCPKNLVDSEIMLGRLLEAGHTITSEASDADCVVVNTCSFIQPAVDESIDTILEMGSWRQQDPKRRLIVVGCLPQRFGKDLAEELPEVDCFLGTGAFDSITEAAQGALKGRPVLLPPPEIAPISDKGVPRVRATPSHTAYVKIAEGCSDKCTYCIIPKLRGPHRSRPMEEVFSEARALAESGVQELILVAQNTTAYGRDLGRGYGLDHLLSELASLSQLKWIRTLYGHPNYVTDGLIETIATHDRLCSYFDIPIQHVSGSILTKMGRPNKSGDLLGLFERIREQVPAAVLRTTVMVGFPGETEADFQSLLDFIEEVRFDHLGAFMYSGAKDLPSNALHGHVAEEVKQERFHRLMTRQAELSGANTQKYIGQTLQALVESPAEETRGGCVGRTWFQAPDIDGIVHIHEGKAKEGMFVKVRITAAHEYDLMGVRV
ncbi:MAG: 30S ribosomal protein S12 methylthiotransferase RimO [Thermodesulfobacteriota bacterium]|nr:30S ribosomal protein S12 methylthiotransferase RimO [Thermodesulfobacteriota bacterium]